MHPTIQDQIPRPCVFRRSHPRLDARCRRWRLDTDVALVALVTHREESSLAPAGEAARVGGVDRRRGGCHRV